MQSFVRSTEQSFTLSPDGISPAAFELGGAGIPIILAYVFHLSSSQGTFLDILKPPMILPTH